jgi:hypothetical protein
MIDSLLIAFVMTQEAIVKITVFCGVHSYEVTSSLVLQNGLDDNFFLLCRQLQKLVQIFFLDPVQLIYVFYLCINFLLNLFNMLR